MSFDAIASRHISVSSRAAIARSDRDGDPSDTPRNGGGGRRGGSAPFVLDPHRKTPDWALGCSPGSSLSVGGRDLSPPGLSHSVRGAPLLLGGGGGALPADQIGWRPAEDEQAARHQTFRQWAREHTGRTDLQDEGGTVLGADIVPGMWTCCRNLDPAAGGCVLTEHCLGDEPWDEMPCDRCGAWVPLGRWDVDKCWHHPGELCRGRWGGHTWGCCGASGVAGTKAALLKPGVWLQRRKDDEQRRLQAQRRAGGGPLVRALPAPRLHDEVSGCAMADRHSCDLDRHLPHGADGLPLRPPCGECGRTARVRQQRCDGCGADQRVCVQCFKVVLASDVAAARASNRPASCRFHPGSFCEARAVRYASNQRKTVHCPSRGCGYAALSNAELATHAKVCPCFEFECEHGCGARLLRRSAAAHLAECDLLPLPCSCGDGCGREVPRQEMLAHRDYYCPAQPVPCRHAGCDAMPPRAELTAHEAACPHTLVFCVRDCGACAPAGQWKGQGAHDVSCPELPLRCAGCGGHQPRRRMERHVTVECPATLLRCARCLMHTPRARHHVHERGCLMKSVMAAWRASVISGRTFKCPHSGGSGDAGGCPFRGSERELRAHLDSGCAFASGTFGPSRARISPQLGLFTHPPHCRKCGAPTALDGTEAVVRVATLTPVLISCKEIDRNGRSRTYGEEVTVKRVGVRLMLGKVSREAHADRCPMATAQCAHCLREFNRLLLAGHEDVCDERKRPCGRKCGALISLSNTPAHNRVCPNAPHPCPYFCGKKVALRHLTFRSAAEVAAAAEEDAGGGRRAVEPIPQPKAKEASRALGGSGRAPARTGVVRSASRAANGKDATGALLCEPCEPVQPGKAQARQPRVGVLQHPRKNTAGEASPPPRARSPPRSAVVRPEPQLDAAHARALVLKLLGRFLLPPFNAARTSGGAASSELVSADQLLASAHPRYLALVFVTGGDRQLSQILEQLARLMASRPALLALLVPLGASEAEVRARRAAVPLAFCLPPLGATNEQVGREYGAKHGARLVLLHLADLGLACFDAARALQADPRGEAFPWAGQAILSSHAARCPRYWHACTNAQCTFSGVRAKLDAHAVSCSWRMLPCRRGCGALLVVSAHKEHELVCPKQPSARGARTTAK